jgi:alkyl hydroperoxide reductase subunit AhpC
MACASCDRNKKPTVSLTQNSDKVKLFGAGDVIVLQGGQRHKLTAEDWPNDKHKLIVFIPEAFTPVCATELGALNGWYDVFQELGCELMAACVDSPDRLQAWLDEEPQLADARYKMLSSYLLPLQLGVLDNGRAKRASVFVMKDGQVVKQEHFDKVGRSLAELHRMLYGYSTDSYCAEGWTSHENGFLEAHL